MSQPKLIKVHTVGSRRSVQFSSDHINNMTTARQVAWQLTELLEERFGDVDETVENADDRELEIDMSQISFLSSVGLNELININRQAKIRCVEIVLADVQDQVRDIFALTRLERMFKFQYCQSPDEFAEIDSTLPVS